MRMPITWKRLWINLALLMSERSKDPKTQVGGVVVSPDNRRIHVGYNGFAIGIKDTEERWERPTKYKFVVHAESNVIINAKEDLHGWTMYLTMPPCPDCSKLIIQAGIKKVIYHHEHIGNANNNDYEFSERMLKEAGVEYECFY